MEKSLLSLATQILSPGGAVSGLRLAGQSHSPQVCIDFIFDTWQRASGNWYKKRGTGPGRTEGFLNFRDFENLPRRHTSSLLIYAEDPETVLERFDFHRKDRVPYRRGAKFAAAIANNANQIQEGDLLVIHGLREEDMEDHYHTVLVLNTDPLTGMPTEVADNAGRPRIRSLSSAMRSAPRRSIKNRLRINWAWLKKQRETYEQSLQPE